MKQKRNLWVYGIIAFTIIFIASSVIFKIFDFEVLPSQFFGALIGVVITAIITVFLLQGQTDNEEKREKSLKVFEKKQEIFHHFLEKLQTIIQDGKISIGQQMEDGEINKSVDELKDLIFQLANLQMLSNSSIVNSVIEKTAELIQKITSFEVLGGQDKQKELSNYYTSLSKIIFDIVSYLKKDLYDLETEDNIDFRKMEMLLSKCNLSVSAEQHNEVEIQLMFWEDLQDYFIEKGFKFEKKNLRLDVLKFYETRSTNYPIVEIPIYSSHKTNKDINFYVSIEKEYFFGFRWSTEPKTDESLKNIVENLFKGMYHNNWGPHRYSKNFPINFRCFSLDGYKFIHDTIKRKQFFKNVFDEMYEYVINLQEIAKSNEV